MVRFSIIRECWKHGDIDASSVIAEFATRGEADAWLASPASASALDHGSGTDEVVLRVQEREAPADAADR